MPRWLQILIALALGLAGGLVYGWVLDPVEYVETTPAILRADYRTDYVLMTAESFQSDQDIALAARRLTVLGDEPPAEIAAQAFEFASQSGYSPSDLDLLAGLVQALQSASGVSP
jgi:hypothetical protein